MVHYRRRQREGRPSARPSGGAGQNLPIGEKRSCLPGRRRRGLQPRIGPDCHNYFEMNHVRPGPSGVPIPWLPRRHALSLISRPDARSPASIIWTLRSHPQIRRLESPWFSRRLIRHHTCLRARARLSRLVLLHSPLSFGKTTSLFPYREVLSRAPGGIDVNSPSRALM
jgi:hypothetical protein